MFTSPCHILQLCFVLRYVHARASLRVHSPRHGFTTSWLGWRILKDLNSSLWPIIQANVFLMLLRMLFKKRAMQEKGRRNNFCNRLRKLMALFVICTV